MQRRGEREICACVQVSVGPDVLAAATVKSARACRQLGLFACKITVLRVRFGVINRQESTHDLPYVIPQVSA